MAWRKDTPMSDLSIVEFDDPLPTGFIRRINTQERRLSTAIRYEVGGLSGANLVFIKSTKGTGKTHVLGEHVRHLRALDPDTRVLQIGHRRSLSRSLSERLGLTSYLDCDGIQQLFSLSLDSLPRINPETCLPYPVLILDESEQVLRHLFGETTQRKRGQIFSILWWLVQNAEQVICTDADLSLDLTIDVISWMRRNADGDHTLAIVNNWKVDRVINVYKSKDHLLAKLVVDVVSGKKVYVPVAEKQLANLLATLFKHVDGPDGKPPSCLVLTGETSDTQQAQDFMANPSAEAKKYQVLIATSTLSTGVSIDGKWFDVIYGLFDSSVYTYQDCDQAISRVRECPSVNVWLHDGRPLKYKTERALHDGPVKKEFMTRKLIAPGKKSSFSEEEKLYLKVETRVRWCESQWSSKRTDKFIALKESEGWVVDLVADNKEMSNAGKEFRRFARDPRGDRHFRLIAEAKNLSWEEYEELESRRNGQRNEQGFKLVKKELSLSDKRAMKKAYVAKVFELSSPAEVTIELVRQVESVSHISKNLRLLAADKDDALHRDTSERTYPKGKAFTEFDHRSVKREIMHSVLEISGISVNEVMTKAVHQSELDQEVDKAKATLARDSRPYRAATKRYRQESKENALVPDQRKLKAACNFIGDNLEKINLFLNTRLQTSDLTEKPGKVLNKVMGEFGISLKLVNEVFHVDYAKVLELAKTSKAQEAAEEIG